MDKYNLYYQVALMEYQATCHRKRDINLRAFGILALAVVLAGIACVVFSDYLTRWPNITALGQELVRGGNWTGDIIIAVGLFVLAFAATFGCAVKTLSIGHGNGAIDVNALSQHVGEDSWDPGALTQWVGDNFRIGYNHNIEELALKARWQIVSIWMLVAVVASLGFLAIATGRAAAVG